MTIELVLPFEHQSRTSGIAIPASAFLRCLITLLSLTAGCAESEGLITGDGSRSSVGVTIRDPSLKPCEKGVRLRQIITVGMQSRDVHQLIGLTVDASGSTLSHTEYYEEYDLAITYNDQGHVFSVRSFRSQ